MAKTTRKRKPASKSRRKVGPVPKGHHTVTPHIVLDDCARALDFYKTALGAKETLRMSAPGGKIPHAEIRIGDSMIMMSDEMPPMPGQPGVYKAPSSAGLTTAAIFLYLKDCDAAFGRAIQAGCTVRQRPTDMFWGDRYGQVIDPFGHTWALATHTEDLTPKQIARREAEFVAKMKQQA